MKPSRPNGRCRKRADRSGRRAEEPRRLRDSLCRREDKQLLPRGEPFGKVASLPPPGARDRLKNRRGISGIERRAAILLSIAIQLGQERDAGASTADQKPLTSSLNHGNEAFLSKRNRFRHAQLFLCGNRMLFLKPFPRTRQQGRIAGLNPAPGTGRFFHERRRRRTRDSFRAPWQGTGRCQQAALRSRGLQRRTHAVWLRLRFVRECSQRSCKRGCHRRFILVAAQ